ncbi:hypothetical protein [Polymorphospora rubra]|uniref:hypothetical protein n=1 Tax=Polymorphospora rubra TaxID=338584 RepID=UPI0033FBE159
MIRPDATEGDIQLLWNGWGRCLEDAGVPMNKDAAGNYGKPDGDLYGQYRPAADKCAVKQPESWMDRERRSDPAFADRLRDAVDCLKEKGYQARIDPEGPRIAYSSTEEFARADADQATCEREAFSEAIASYGNG